MKPAGSLRLSTDQHNIGAGGSVKPGVVPHAWPEIGANPR